jgi:hypothetical protein
MSAAKDTIFDNSSLIAKLHAHEAEPDTALRVGDRVHHAKFGFGTVSGLDGKGALVVEFDRTGAKRVAPAFLSHTATIIPFPAHRIVRRRATAK